MSLYRPVLWTLSLAVASCGSRSPAPPEPANAVVDVAPPQDPDAGSTSACPSSFTEAELFVPEPSFDLTPLALAPWLSRAAPPTSSGRTAIDLGTIEYFLPTKSGLSVGGFGWQALNPAWLAGTLAPAIETELAHWDRLGDARMDHYVHAVACDARIEAERRQENPDLLMIRCLEEEAKASRLRAQPIEEAIDEQSRKLVEALQKKDARTSGETFLLASLSVDLIAHDAPDREAQLAPIRDWFLDVSGDPDAPIELRARAREQLARETDDPEQRASHLRAVLTYTRDPEIQADSHLKLAQLVTDENAREKHLVTALALLETMPEKQWLIAFRGLDLARIYMRRNDYERAREVVLRAVWASRPLDHDRPDPWRVSEVLAEVLIETRAHADDDVPRGFAGPLAVALLGAARDRNDRALGRAIAEELLRIAPEAPEVTEALIALTALSEGEERRAYEAALAPRVTLNEAPELAWGADPARPDALEPEALRQLRAAVSACAASLSEAKSKVSLTVRNHPSAIQIEGADEASQRCLERRLPSRFRGFPPIAISVRLEPR